MNKKQALNIILISFFVGALGSILLGRFFIPWMASVTRWETLNRLVTSSPIIINRTTEVQLNEGVNLVELGKQLTGITVSIYNDSIFQGLGTIMSSDGLIFTSRNSIRESNQVRVVLSDGRIFEGLVRAADPKSDLVILTIQAEGLPTASFGSSFDLTTGQRVVTTGIANRVLEREFNSGLVTNSVLNNKGLAQTISSERLADGFGTDLRLLSNYSGAPVANLDGRLVGMIANDKNEIIIAENLQTALNSYLQSGKITRPTLGIEYTTLSGLQAGIQNSPKTGIVILGVGKSSPAALAGILAKDLIFEVNGKNFDNTSFEQILNQSNTTDQLKIKLLRGTKEIELTVNLKPTP
ncbi:MAG: hypothetical protein A3I07_02130 [Candidatus Doudnabacteria bacterium RIFCSPLOWO2_02_FULL_42_9]|uniref:PDZ domain-containing protein n=1 Tax=Candidatus Doudnabacteria bacterium RIFCSPHIGHO2_01_FULL_41_86 TaxID=1817821 RepID=A0A1F5N7U5_9BACT|nr:MAG: hypothetical protein A2717_03480 [Candidatus Doudnabacteria bacterium RIFCSPHIGHO2_01_FULL_41_86]OGE74738.1 MAG: hypothetical protein A3K07_03080 [Candidatus Doudnabacteria bacterium RIFCSPHIGHO2_01_43_10]OGE85704.1 MAG: hypothetical protein A3E28_02810 [Candidatus Doudnabacteria bacterium RIFCSPHIGHO2_12_FULL_42_22]OGE87200.1 MAG: hypothetical protein A3C49_00440 [Candidatus Doudnabacteria bacterium RIFCSPHIGHO2_02_FULL_42_25]OGE92037.1 MAG: hypothetical protein A2895_00315 [Candidatus